jgi:hypothetical protein
MNHSSNHKDNFDFPAPEYESEEEALRKEDEKLEKADRKYRAQREQSS